MAKKEWKENFKGTGPLKPLTDQCNELFEMLNNIEIIMPKSYSGFKPTLTFDKDGKLVFDFQEALIFTLRNVKWVTSGNATVSNKIVSVEDGQLVISFSANRTCP
jgi:hypothetical protein